MKKLSYYLHGIISVSVVILLFTGCSIRYVTKANEFSTLQTGSPLRSVPSRTFAFREFKDVRNTDNPSLLMTKDINEWVLEPPPAVMVPILIKKELERNGHKCVTFSPQVKADFIVEGNIYRYTGHLDVVPFGSQINSVNTGVKIMISAIPPERGFFVKSYEGGYTEAGGFMGFTLESCMIKAFMSMIKEISTDIELVEFINQSATVKTSGVSPADEKMPEKIETKKREVVGQVPADSSSNLPEQRDEVQKKESPTQEKSKHMETIVVDKKPGAKITKPNIPNSSTLGAQSNNSGLSENDQKFLELKKPKDEKPGKDNLTEQRWTAIERIVAKQPSANVVDKKPITEITKPNISPSSNLGTQSNNSNLSESGQKLRELKKLRAEGLLTEEEYAQKRKAIVDGM